MAQSNLGKVMLMPRGNYSAGETYNMLDFVLHGGASFVALENDLRGVTPSADSPSWQLLAAAAEEIYVESQTVEYAAQAEADYTGDPPESGWSSEVPPAQNGNYLWTRIITTYSDGTSFTAYLVAKNGVNGTGAVASVNGVNPDANGNVLLTIGNIATVDQTPTAGSNNLVTSGGVNQFVYGVLSGKENTSNKVTVWGATPSDEKYPSEKLVKDSLDAQSSQISDLQDDKADKATTLAGYGITDTYTKTEIDQVKYASIQPGAGNYLAKTAYFQKYGKIKFAYINTIKQSIPTKQSVVLCNLPEGFERISYNPINDFFYDNGKKIRLQLSSANQISVYVYETDATDLENFYCTFSYI